MPASKRRQPMGHENPPPGRRWSGWGRVSLEKYSTSIRDFLRNPQAPRPDHAPTWVLLAAAMLVLWAFRVPMMVVRLIEVAGIAPMPSGSAAFFFAPVGVILLRSLLVGNLRIPYWRSFFVTVGVLFIRELRLVQSLEAPDYSYAWGLVLFYLSFVALANLGTHARTQRFLRRAAMWCMVAIIPIVLMGMYLGLELQSSADLARDRSRDLLTILEFHPNGMSFAAAVVMLLLLSRGLEECRLRAVDGVLVAALIAIVVFHASRGTLLTIVGLLTAFGLSFTARLDPETRSRVTAVALIAVAVIFANYLFGKTVAGPLATIERFAMDGGIVSRPQQVYVTWTNFTRYPLLGRGHFNAGRGVIRGQYRSNFHFTQVLAAYGALGFIPFMWLMFRLFGQKLRDPRLKLHAIVALGALSFYNWSVIMPLALVAHSALAIRNRPRE